MWTFTANPGAADFTLTYSMLHIAVIEFRIIEETPEHQGRVSANALYRPFRKQPLSLIPRPSPASD